jgi:hypothetical protein
LSNGFSRFIYSDRMETDIYACGWTVLTSHPGRLQYSFQQLIRVCCKIGIQIEKKNGSYFHITETAAFMVAPVDCLKGTDQNVYAILQF